MKVVRIKNVLPYGQEKLPGYLTGHAQDICPEEFQLFYGGPLPGEKTGFLEMNDALCQMKYAKSGFCRLIYRVLQKKMD